MQDELQKIYDSEINLSISWEWDGGIVIRIGDEMNGFSEPIGVDKMSEIVPKLREVLKEEAKSSTYVKNL